MPPIARTPEPPYTAVIFTSIRAGGSDTRGSDHDDDYATTDAAMVELAARQPGYLGLESAREQLGVTVSYWATAADARAWKDIGAHRLAQQQGRERWYRAYRVRIATVEREYGSDAGESDVGAADEQ